MAASFLQQVDTLTSRPDNVGLSGPRKRREGRGEVARRGQVDKRHISSPCGFRHNVSVSLEDFSTYFSLQLHLKRRQEQS